MKYKLEKTGAPAYLQLYEQMRAEIVAGVYAYGARLPSKRLIAEELGISTITVAHTYALLCDEGYATARERSGFFVAFRATDGFAIPEKKKTAPAPHTVTAGDHFPFSVLAKTMRRVLAEYGDGILEQTAGAGCIALRQAIADYLARNRGIYVTTEQIVIGSGAEYLYGMIVELLGADRRYAIEAPSYEKIERVYAARGVQCAHLPMGEEGIEAEALASTDAQVLHISPFRSFPTGITASASKRHAYVRWASEGARVLVEDDYASEISVSAKTEETLFALSGQDNVIYLNTFSCTVSPAVRVGYMVLPKHLVSVFGERLGFYACTVPTFEQLVLAELLASGDFERHINRLRRKKRAEMQ